MKAAARALSRRDVAVLAAITAMGVLVATAPFDAPPSTPSIGLAIVLVTVALFASAPISGLAIAAVFFGLALATGVVAPWTLAQGFWANATMLILGGLIIGAAADRSGLGRFVARGLLRQFSSSYSRLLLGILVGTGALSFLVPSTMGRLAITVPVVIALAREAGYAQGSSGYTAMILATVAGNFLTSYGVLSANLLGVIVTGSAEALYGPQLTYAEYLLLCGPVLGLVKIVTFWLMLRLLLPAPPPSPGQHADDAILTPAGRRLAVLLACTVALWATDSWHGWKPGWIALGAGLCCLVPPIALVRPREMLEVNRLTGVVSVPVMLGLASVLTTSGAGRVISTTLLSTIPLEGGSPVLGFVAVTLLSAASAIVATTVGCVAIMTPLLDSIGAATGLSIKAAVIAELTGLQSIFFHYEAMPVMVGLVMGRVGPWAAFRFLAPLAVTGLLVILPLNIGWMKLMGVLP